MLILIRIGLFDLLAVLGTLESSPTTQFESISSSVLSLLYGSTLTSIQDYWKNQSFDYIDLAMAPHSSILAWKIPWTEEPAGLQSMGSRRVGHD